MPKQRSFADTVNKQNRDNKALREQILLDKIAKLQEELYDTEHALDYAATDPYGGCTSTHQKPVLQLPPAFSPHGLTPRVPRPQDVAYQAALKQDAAQEKEKTIHEVDQQKSEEGVLIRHSPTTTIPTFPQRRTSPAKTMNGKRGIANFAPTLRAGLTRLQHSLQREDLQQAHNPMWDRLCTYLRAKRCF
jgi:hypothetical protein